MVLTQVYETVLKMLGGSTVIWRLDGAKNPLLTWFPHTAGKLPLASGREPQVLTIQISYVLMSCQLTSPKVTDSRESKAKATRSHMTYPQKVHSVISSIYQWIQTSGLYFWIDWNVREDHWGHFIGWLPHWERVLQWRAVKVTHCDPRIWHKGPLTNSRHIKIVNTTV